MNLYRLTRTDPDDYDDARGFVVAAPDEPSARALPSTESACGDECRRHVERSGDPRPCVWLSEAATTCELIGTAADGWTSCVVLRDFHAG